MKKLIFSLLFTFTVSLIFAQDLKKAKSYLDSKQLDKAKTEIDAYVAKSPNEKSVALFDGVGGFGYFRGTANPLQETLKRAAHDRRRYVPHSRS